MLHLRQICLAAAELEPVISDLAAIFDIEVCVRDFHVAIYGLSNALLPFGTDFLEVVAPQTEGTAVARFLSRGVERGAYMAIFECQDPERRQLHVEALGIRTPHVIDRPEYRNVQMHPKDCRATILEFARSNGDQSQEGDWWPAGPDWKAVAGEGAQAPAMVGMEIAAPDPRDLAMHWSRILELPLDARSGVPTLSIEGCDMRFVRDDVERVSTLTIAVADPARALTTASRRGRSVASDGFALAGIRFRLTAHDAPALNI